MPRMSKLLSISPPPRAPFKKKKEIFNLQLDRAHFSSLVDSTVTKRSTTKSHLQRQLTTLAPFAPTYLPEKGDPTDPEIPQIFHQPIQKREYCRLILVLEHLKRTMQLNLFTSKSQRCTHDIKRIIYTINSSYRWPALSSNKYHIRKHHNHAIIFCRFKAAKSEHRVS